MNVLYIGVENPISFAVENIKCGELTLVVEDGTAQRTNGCDYVVSVTRPGTTFLYLIKGRDTIHKSIYRVKEIPDPVTDLGRNEAYRSLDSLRSQRSLSAVSKYFNFDTRFSIMSFEITVVRARQLGQKKKIYCDEYFKEIENRYYEIIFSQANEGSDFNDSLRAFIQHTLKPGDKVFIDNIKAQAPDNIIRHLGSISFKVV